MASGAGVGATKALVAKREQAVTTPMEQAFFPLFRATDLISGDRSTRATSQKTGMAMTYPVAASAPAARSFPVI